MMYQVILPPDGNLQPMTLQQLVDRAEWTVLYFYPKDDTPGCTTEAIEFSRLAKEFSNYHTQIVGVSKDAKDTHCGFMKKHELNVILVSDPTLQLHKRYGARGEKNMYGKVTEGTIRSTFILNQKLDLIHSRKNIKAGGHAEKVLARVDNNLLV